MIVVDVGCCNHGVDSVMPLIERFHPSTLFGFDPHCVDSTYVQDDTLVEVSHRVAWAYDGQVGFRPDGTSSRVEEGYVDTVDCFDFGAWLEPLLRHDVVVKLDCEGSEFGLIDVMRQRGQLGRLQLLLVEWHFPCPVEEWTL